MYPQYFMHIKGPVYSWPHCKPGVSCDYVMFQIFPWRFQKEQIQALVLSSVLLALSSINWSADATQCEHQIPLTVCTEKRDMYSRKFLFYNQTDLWAQWWWDGLQKRISQLSAFADVGHDAQWMKYLVTKNWEHWLWMRGPPGSSISLIWGSRFSCSSPALLGQRPLGRGPGSCVSKLPGDSDAAQDWRAQVQATRQALHYPHHFMPFLCWNPEGKIKDPWIQGQWSSGPDFGDLREKLSVRAGLGSELLPLEAPGQHPISLHLVGNARLSSPQGLASIRICFHVYV